MPEIKFDGKLDGKSVKEIIRTTEKGTMYMLKPKNLDTNTPHFMFPINGKMEVHEDSPDSTHFRKMTVNWDGSIDSGISFFENRGLHVAVVPMHATADGFAIGSNPDGVNLKAPERQWWLYAVGKYGPWQEKPNH